MPSTQLMAQYALMTRPPPAAAAPTPSWYPDHSFSLSPSKRPTYRNPCSELSQPQSMETRESWAYGGLGVPTFSTKDPRHDLLAAQRQDPQHFASAEDRPLVFAAQSTAHDNTSAFVGQPTGPTMRLNPGHVQLSISAEPSQPGVIPHATMQTTSDTNVDERAPDPSTHWCDGAEALLQLHALLPTSP